MLLVLPLRRLLASPKHVIVWSFFCGKTEAAKISEKELSKD